MYRRRERTSSPDGSEQDVVPDENLNHLYSDIATFNNTDFNNVDLRMYEYPLAGDYEHPYCPNFKPMPTEQVNQYEQLDQGNM